MDFIKFELDGESTTHQGEKQAFYFEVEIISDFNGHQIIEL